MEGECSCVCGNVLRIYCMRCIANQRVRSRVRRCLAVTLTSPPLSPQTAASRLTQLLGTALDTEADVADEAAQPAAILNDVDACAQ